MALKILDLRKNVEEKKELKEEKLLKRKARRKRIRKIILFSLLGVFLIFIGLVLITLFSFLRYRQICTYSNLVTNGEAVDSSQNNLCPNILDKNEWKSVVTQAFNPSILASVKVNPSYTSSTNISNSQTCDANTDPICWLKELKGTLQNSNGITNVMLIGVDSRANQISGNTDSIMVASFDNVSGKILLISFPRDLFVKYSTPEGWSTNGRINAIFAIWGLDTFKNALADIIGKPIQYYVFLDFQTFTKVIDEMGGIDINLPQPFLNVYPRPDTEAAGQSCNPADFAPDGFCVFQFPAGPQHFNSFQALVYARSRELTTDWDRAARQQQVVTAVLKNALDKQGSLQDKFNFYTNIYNTILSSITTNITINDIGGMFKYVDILSSNPAQVVLSPDVNNGNLVYEYGVDPNYGDISKFYDNSYTDVHNFLNSIWNYLPYYLDNPKILVVNETKNPIPASSNLGKFIAANIPYTTIKQVTDTSTALKGTRIYDFSNGSKQGTINDIEKRIPDALIYNPIIDNLTQSKFGEDILIVYGG